MSVTTRTSPQERSAGLGASIGAVTTRHALKALRTPPVIMLAVGQSVLFLLIFRYVFGGAITVDALAYVDYMVPGLLVVAVLFSVMGVGAAVADDLAHGVVDRWRSLPMAHSAVLIGRVVAELGVTALVLVATTGVAYVVGFRVNEGAVGLIATLALCLAAAATFASLFVVLGLMTANVQAAQGLGMLVMPFAFLSSTYVPTSTMPGWLEVFAEHQPVTVLANAARYLSQGSAGVADLPASGPHYVALGLIWCGAILAVVVPLSVVFFRRR